MASHGGGGATQRHSLSTCHPNGATVALKEDTASVAELKDLKVVVCLLVGEALEDKQTQELAMDASRGRHGCLQESHLPIALIRITIGADLVSSGALKDLIWVVSRRA